MESQDGGGAERGVVGRVTERETDVIFVRIWIKEAIAHNACAYSGDDTKCPCIYGNCYVGRRMCLKGFQRDDGHTETATLLLSGESLAPRNSAHVDIKPFSESI